MMNRIKKLAKEIPTQSDSATGQRVHAVSMPRIVGYTLAFLASLLISLAPLDRLAGTDYFRSLPISSLLLAVGTWLPLDLHLTENVRQSQRSTHLILFLACMALAFVIYALYAWYIQRREASSSTYRHIMRWTWIGAILAGLAFVFTPAMLSHDAFVYAGYGRLLTIYHANPYFVTLSAYPQDPFMRLDDWNSAPAAYGPVWLAISALGSIIAGENPLMYILLYRLFGLAAHLVTILLVTTLLRKQGCSERTVTVGTLLYAWNPLVLQESSLGAHMDTFMATLMLLGILLWARVEQRNKGIPGVRDYLPSLVAFTLAALIKFTAAPIIVFFLVLLARKTLSQQDMIPSLRHQWRPALRIVLSGALLSGGFALAFYLPFWAGHSIAAIISSFTSPPSANAAYGSILSALLNWIKLQSDQSWRYTPLYLLSLHSTWQAITIVTLAILLACGIVWVWRSPTIRTLALATLASLGALLLVTPWFFPWYVVWLLGLAAICLPTSQNRIDRIDRIGRALVGATFVFSASAFFIYLFRGLTPIGAWEGFTFLTTIGPPLLTFLFLLPLPRKMSNG